jgi:hypothetical protein
MSQSNSPEVQWDLNGASVFTSNVANSTAGPDDVVLNFGATQRPSEASPEMAVELLRKITLRPQTARTLRDMLRDVIADIDADRMRGNR